MNPLLKKLLSFWSFVSVSILFSIFSFTSCEVGLGATVDVEAPKLSITYPPELSIIRESFVLAGTVSDDKMVSAIQITIEDADTHKKFEGVYKNLETHFSVSELTGETDYKSGGTWQCEVNVKNENGVYPLKDGSYIVSVKAVDGSNRSSAASSRTFDIDNSSPIFVIDTPGSDENPTAYGSSLKIEGNIADSHRISVMRLSVKDPSNGKEYSWTDNKNVTKGEVNVPFARYTTNTAKQDELHDRYLNIYGAETKGDKFLLTSVLISDNAGIYRTPVFTDSKDIASDDASDEIYGNTTSVVWLNDEINGESAGKNDLLSPQASSQYSLDNLVSIYNGNVENPEVLSVLESLKIDTSEKNLPVTLNKDANPTYEISGFSFTGSSTEKSASRESTVTLKADSGLDGIGFLPKKLTVYLAGPFEENEFSEDLLSAIYENPDEFVENPGSFIENKEKSSFIQTVFDNSSDVATTTKSFSKSFTLPSYLYPHKYYLFVLTGTDNYSVSFVPANGFYGFKAPSSGVAPTVSINEKDSSTYKDISSFSFEGKAFSTEKDIIESVSYEISVFDVVNSKELGTISGNAEITKGELLKDSDVDWLIDLENISGGLWNGDSASDSVILQDVINPAEGKVYQYTVKVTAKTDIEGSSSKSIVIDCEKPSVEITSVLPYAKTSEIDGVECYLVNEKIKITTNCSDTNFESAFVSIKGENGSELLDKYPVSLYTTKEIDTKEIYPGTDKQLRLYITLTATDKAGNTKSFSETHYVIDQSTDIPEITLSNVDAELFDETKLTFIEEEGRFGNVFDHGQNNKLLGMITDDDKIDFWSIEYMKVEKTEKNPSGETKWDTLVSKKDVNSPSVNISAELKTGLLVKKNLEEGVYKIRLTAKDKKSDASSIVTKTTEPFLIAVDASSPEIIINTNENELYKAGGSLTISGTVSDASGLVRLYKNEIEIPVTDGNWTDTITCGNESETITYTAYDKYGKSSSKNFTYSIDDEAPVPQFNISSLLSDGVKENKVNGVITITGSVTDNDKVTKTEIELYSLNGTETGEKLETLLSKTENASSFSFTKDTTALTDETDYRIIVKSTDRAGNSASVYKDIYVDQSTDKPVVTVSNASSSGSVGAADIKTGVNLFNTTGNNKLIVSITDDDGLSTPVSVKCYKVNSSNADTDEECNTEREKQTVKQGTTSASFNYILPSSEGKYKIVISAVDSGFASATEENKAYHTNDSAVYYVGVDSGSPSLRFNSQSGAFAAADTALNVSGISTDSSGTVKLYRYADKTVDGVLYTAKTLSQARENGKPVKDSDGNDLAESVITVMQKGDGSQDDGAFTDVIPASVIGSSGREIYYVAEDLYAQCTVLSFVYKIDSLSPTVMDGWAQNENDTKWTKNSSYTYVIPLSDAWDKTAGKALVSDSGELMYSDIETVQLVVKKVNADSTETEVNSVLMTKGDFAGTSGVSSYYRNYTSDIPFKNGDGLYKAYVKATDKAGITSENLGTFVNKIDTTSPVLGTVSIPAFAQDGINKAEKENLSETPFTLSVSVSDVSSKVKQFKVYRDSTEITENVTVTPAVSAADGIYADGEYVFTVSENSIGTTGKYKFSITAVDFAGNEATVSSSTVTVDLDEPVISSFNEKQNAVEIDGVNYWNGIITVTGNVSDDELTAGENGIVSWALYTKSGENYTPLSGNGTSGSTKLNGSGTVTNAVFSFTIDTTLADSTENGGDYYLKVSVKDKCGNVSQTAYTLLKIRQSTDKPEISFSNANPSLSEAEISTELMHNLFGMGNNTIYGTITDDDGIESVEVKIDGVTVTKTEGGEEVPLIYVSNNPKSVSLQFNLGESGTNPLNISAGNHTLTINVQDCSEGLSSDLYTYSSVQNMHFAFDNETPSVSIIKANGTSPSDGMFCPETFDIWFDVTDDTFDASDENKRLSPSLYSLKVNGTETAKTDYPSGESFTWALYGNGEDNVSGTADDVYKWKYSSVNENGKSYERIFIFEDKYGRAGVSSTLKYSVDTENPVLNGGKIIISGSNNGNENGYAVNTLSSASETLWFNESSLKIASADGNALVEKNMESLSVNVSGISLPYPVNTSLSDSENVLNTFSTSISFADGKSKTVSMKAKDKAGQESALLSFQINVDTVIPSVSSASITAMKRSVSGENVENIVERVTNSDKIYISVSGNDSTSGIKKIYIGTTDGFPVTAALKTVSLDEETLNLSTEIETDISSLADGNVTLFARVEDLAGNISASKKITYSYQGSDKDTFVRDTTPPVVTVSTPAAGSTVDKTVSFTGTVIDSNLGSDVSKPSLWKYGENSSWTKLDTVEGTPFVSTSSSGINSWKFDFDTTAIDETSGHETEVYLQVRITDEAGNVTVLPLVSDNGGKGTFKLTVNQDNDRPVIKFSDIEDSSSTTILYRTAIKGSVSDADGLNSSCVFKISPVPKASLEEWESFENETADSEVITNGRLVFNKSSGDFTYTPADQSDGSHDIYLYFKDSKGEVFVTNYGQALKRPFVLYANAASESEKVDNFDDTSSNPPVLNGKISYTTDQTRPEIAVLVMGSGSTEDEAFADAAEQFAGGQDNEMRSSTLVGGKNRKWIVFAISATDKRGTETSVITDVTYKTPVSTTSGEKNYNASQNVPFVQGTKTYYEAKGGKPGEGDYVRENGSFVLVTSENAVIYEDETAYTKNTVSALYSSALNVESLGESENSSCDVVFIATDEAGLTNEKIKTIVYTNQGPEITVTTPEPSSDGKYSQGKIQAGNDTTISGTASASQSGTVTKVLYHVLSNTEYVYFGREPDVSSGANLVTTEEERIGYINTLINAEENPLTDNELINSSRLCKNSATKSSWIFKFDDRNNSFLPVVDDENQFLTEYGYLKHSENGIYELPVWIYAIDALGNESCAEFVLKNYNPYGDRPIAVISYPEFMKTTDAAGNTVTESYAKVSGSMRVSGSAVDNTSVNAVYVQIDTDKDGDYDLDDLNYLLTNGYDISTCEGASLGGTVLSSISGITLINDGYWTADPDFWGIKVSGTSSWYINLNKSGELRRDGVNSESETIGMGENAVTNTIYKINVRAAALDNNNRLGSWSDSLDIRIDPSAPSIGGNVEPYVIVYKAVETNGVISKGDFVKTRAYSTDMWLSDWCELVVSVSHENGLDSLDYYISDTQANLGSATAATGSEWKGNLIDTKDGWDSLKADSNVSHPFYNASSGKGYLVTIPLNTQSGAGSRSVKISAVSSSTNLPSDGIFTFQYDNVAPSITNVTSNGTAWESTSSDTAKAIQNENYSTSVGSDVTDSNSGFDFALYYIYRDERNSTNGKNRRIYDMNYDYSVNQSKAKIDVLGENDSDEDGMCDVKDGIAVKTVGGVPVYGRNVTVTRDAPGSVTFSASDDYITSGLAVCIKDVWVVLSDKSENTYRISENIPQTEKTVFVPYAKTTTSEIVTEEASGFGTENEVLRYDDGDGLVEKVSKLGGSWTWTSGFHGNYVPDGIINFALIAFDKSGNVSAVKRVGKIQNNAPRLTKLHLATDLTGDEKFGDDEFITYDILQYGSLSSTEYAKGGASDFDLTTAGFTGAQDNPFAVKSLLGVLPEFTGSYINGESMLMVYKLGDETGVSASSTRKVQKPSTASTTVKELSSGTSYLKSSNISFTGGNLYTLTNKQVTGVTENGTLSGENDGDGKHISFTFWDNTDECEQGVDSQSCYVQVTDFKIDVVDSENPKVIIEPFKWNGTGFAEITDNGGNVTGYRPKNNLYYEFKSSGEQENSPLEPVIAVNGHIELESDWKTTDAYDKFTKNTTGFTSTEFDGDPKVSGKIVFRGTAYDDVRLDSLWIAFDSFTPAETAYLSDSDYVSVIGSTTVNGKTTSSGVTYYKAAKFDSSSENWTSIGDKMTAEGWGFKVIEDGINDSESFFNQNGHRVNWEFYFDTAKITGATKKDAKVYVMALDANGKLLSSSTAAESDLDSSTSFATKNVPFYQMDVVPYITSVTTSLSAMYKADGSVYGRTALGKYPVHEGEEITINGFNFGDSQSVTLGGISLTASEKKNSSFKAAIGETAGSGALVVTAGECVTLNNYNANDSKGSVTATLTESNYASYAYNRVPNGVNNNTLTDDAYVDVWEFINAAEPRNGKSDNPTMKISSQGRIGISFSNAVVYFSAPFIDYGETQSVANVKSQTAIAENYGWFTNNTFCFDQYGYPYAAAQSPDTDTAIGAAFLQFFSRQTGDSIGNMGLEENYQKIAGSSRIEAICIPIKSGENEWTTDIDRTQSIAMTTSMPSPTSAPSASNQVTVHMAYWDNLTKQIRYRYAKVGETAGDYGNRTWKADKTDSNGETYYETTEHLDSMRDLQGCGSTYDWGRRSMRFNHCYDSISSNANNHASGQHIYRVAGTSLGDGYLDAYKVTTTHEGGKFVDIGVLPSTSTAAKPTVVICWYDGVNKNLVLSYDTPSDSDTAITNGMYSGNWQAAGHIATISENGGMYCRMAIDADDGIHIAHYDSLAADLLYTYVPVNNGVPQFDDAETIVVDSFLSVGTWCTIDVAKVKDGTKYNHVPQIGYFVPACEDTSAGARIATPVRFDSNGYPTFDGAVNDKYTGAWEITTVPTERIPIIDRVNVGVHKTTVENVSGVLTAIPTDGTHSKLTSSVKTVNKPSYPVSDTTTVYGNGTLNPAVVYCVDDGPVELAQKK